MQNEQGVPIFYANAVGIKISSFDMILDFGLNIPSFDDKTKKFMPNIKQIASIAMSPQHYKVLCEVMQGQLKVYEKRFGEIKIAREKASTITEKRKQ